MGKHASRVIKDSGIYLTNFEVLQLSHTGLSGLDKRIQVRIEALEKLLGVYFSTATYEKIKKIEEECFEYGSFTTSDLYRIAYIIKSDVYYLIGKENPRTELYSFSIASSHNYEGYI